MYTYSTMILVASWLCVALSIHWLTSAYVTCIVLAWLHWLASSYCVRIALCICWLPSLIFNLCSLHAGFYTRNLNTVERFFNSQLDHACMAHSWHECHSCSMHGSCMSFMKNVPISHVPCMEHETWMYIGCGTCMVKHA